MSRRAYARIPESRIIALPTQTPSARCPWTRPGGCACSLVRTFPRRSDLAYRVSSGAVKSTVSTFVKAQHDTSLSISDDLGIDSPPPLPALLYLVRLTQSPRRSQSSVVVTRANGNCSLVPRLAVMTTSERREDPIVLRLGSPALAAITTFLREVSSTRPMH